MTMICPKCNGAMERGFATALGLIGPGTSEKQRPRLPLVVAGTPTSHSPVEAFKQGLSDERPDRAHEIVGARCSQCGFLELYGDGG